MSKTGLIKGLVCMQTVLLYSLLETEEFLVFLFYSFTFLYSPWLKILAADINPRRFSH